MKKLDENGHEVPDPRPVAIPAGFKRPETLAEQVRRLVRTSLSQQAHNEGMETFEEAEDFDVGDDIDPRTPYETFFDPELGMELTPQEFKQHEQIYRERYLKAQADYFKTMDRHEVMSRRYSMSEPPDDAIPPPVPPAKPSGRRPRKRPETPSERAGEGEE